MKFSVEPWAPEYGAPLAAELEPAGAAVEVDIEVAAADWRPISSEAEPASNVLFVDGVRRVDANVWIVGQDEVPTRGVCASYSAGAVLCNGSAEIVGAEVRRGLFSSSAEARPIVTDRATYQVNVVAGSSPEELWLGVQQRMGDLEQQVAIDLDETDLVLVDGPLSGRALISGAVGYVKTHQVQYLPPALQAVLVRLNPTERTPLFATTTSWSRYSWYLRLPGGGDGPMAGIVRCEASADSAPKVAAGLADRVAATLPRFASGRHKDPRAPQNLYPIGGLERHLRRRLGDRELLYRALLGTAARLG